MLRILGIERVAKKFSPKDSSEWSWICRNFRSDNSPWVFTSGLPWAALFDRRLQQRRSLRCQGRARRRHSTAAGCRGRCSSTAGRCCSAAAGRCCCLRRSPVQQLPCGAPGEQRCFGCSCSCPGFSTSSCCCSCPACSNCCTKGEEG